SMLTGIVAAGAVLLAQPFLSGLFATQGFAAWHWLLPASYAALAAPRLMAVLKSLATPTAGTRADSLEDVLDAVVMRMAPDGDVIAASRRSERLLGVQPALLLGDGLFERIHIGDRIAYLSALADVREGQPSATIELRLR